MRREDRCDYVVVVYTVTRNYLQRKMNMKTKQKIVLLAKNEINNEKKKQFLFLLKRQMIK